MLTRPASVSPRPPAPVERARVRLTKRGKVAAGVVSAAAIAAVAAWLHTPIGLHTEGLTDGGMIGAAAAEDLRLTLWTGAPGALDRAALRLDGDDVTPRARDGDRLTLEPVLEDGEHRLTLSVPRRFPLPDLVRGWDFTVDTEAPVLEVTSPAGPLIGDAAPVLAGRMEPGAALTLDGEPLEVEGEAFRIDLGGDAARRELVLVATDTAGNITEDRRTLVRVPSRVTPDDGVRSVHVSFEGWADPALREPVLAMAERDAITSVQLDLKDETGMVGYESQVPLVRQIGAVAAETYDLAAAVADLHERGVSVVGRIVAFADPVLATNAWENDRRDLVVQTRNGNQYGGYGGFTNFAHPEVREYLVDLAVEAAAAGVDGILWDYVRRPDGDLDGFSIPGLEGTPEEAIAGFLAESHDRLAPYGVDHGASVYGVAATRPTEIGQDIPAMAESLDYVAPMVYPSHWGPGEYGVADPNRQPYEIVRRSLADFQRAVEGTGARVVPWLQDFSLGVTYRTAEVKAQIDAAADIGIDEWLLWDAGTRYTESALAN